MFETSSGAALNGHLLLMATSRVSNKLPLTAVNYTLLVHLSNGMKVIMSAFPL